MNERFLKIYKWTIYSLAAVGAFLTIGFLTNEALLNNKQDVALQELRDNKEKISDNTIILTKTSKDKATSLANEFNAEVRLSFNNEFAVLTLPESVTVEDIYSNKTYRKYLDQMSFDYKVQLCDVVEEEPTEEVTVDKFLSSSPNYNVTDPMYSQQYWLNYINLQDTWAKTKGKKANGEKVVVAVIDTGIDYDHPEFIDANGNTIISPWSYNAHTGQVVKDYVLENGQYDWSIVEDQDNEIHGAFHGTLVTGVIAAQMNNGVGITGIAPDVEILTIKCKLNDDGSIDSSDCVMGLYYAIERDVDVVNMSFGIELERDWIDPVKLGHNSDIIMVASAGNGNISTPIYPAACEKVIGVGALAKNSWNKASYSNYGDWVDVFAPEANISTTNGGGYDFFSGTSSSAPVVAAIMALYKSQHPYTTFDSHGTDFGYYETLIASTKDIGDIGQDFYYGWGAVDTNALLWEEKGIVTFDTLSDEVENTKQVFVRGHALQNIPELERKTAVYDGWYNDIQTQDEINYYEDVWTNDLTLYAKWINEDEGIPYTYSYLSDGTVELNKYTGKRRYITVPSEINGKEVTSIGSECFAYNTRIRQVTLPESLKHIKSGAFLRCTNLLNIVIPSNVVSIGDSAFRYASKLSSVGISTSGSLTSIERFAFADCGRLSRIDLPTGLQSVTGEAFVGATSLKDITIPSGNTNYTILDGALYTKNLNTIVYLPSNNSGNFTIDSTTKNIGDYAFAYSRKTNITIPSGVEYIGNDAFTYSNIRTLFIPNTVLSFKDEAIFNPGNTFSNCYYLKSVEFEDGCQLKKLSSYCFSDCNSLTNVDFGSNSQLETIDIKAFESCYSLNEITIPSGVKSIGAYAFFSAGLDSVTFESNNTLEHIYSIAFFSNSNLTSINLPSSVKRIGDDAFSNTGLTSFNIGPNIESMGLGVNILSNCSNLTTITIDPSNSNYIVEDNTIYYLDGENHKVLYCRPNGLTSDFTLSSDVYRIDESAFRNNKLQHITFNEGLKEIGAYAFYGCKELQSLTFPNSLETIESFAFGICSSISGNVVLTKNLVSIGYYAFAWDYKITSITFDPENRISRLGDAAFARTGITSFTIPSSVTSIGTYLFSGCKNLTSVTFEDNSQIDNFPAYVFGGADKLESIDFGENNNIKKFLAHSFSNLSNLKTINWSELTKLQTIDNYAFMNCSKLQTPTFNSSLKEIGRFAFANCTSIERFDIPTSVEFIGRYAFTGLSNTSVYFESTSISNNFQEDWDYGILGYFIGVREVRENTDYTYALLNDNTVSIVKYKGSDTNLVISTIDGYEVTQIGACAFENNTTIQSIQLPATLNAIHERAFKGTTSLTSIVIPSGVSSISNYAFYESGITSITLPSGLVTIGDYAFAKTTNLSSISIPNTVTKIGKSAFSNASLSTITFETDSTLETIGKSAFENSQIEAITLPDSLVTIDSSAFANTSRLTSVDLGEGVYRINANAFNNSAITGELVIPASLEYIGEYAFTMCSNLLSFSVDSNNNYYSNNNGVLMNKDQTRIVCCPSGKTGSYTIGDDVLTLAFGAFEGSKLSEVIISDDSKLLTIGNRAFFSMKNLTSINIPDSVLSIDYYAFAYCDKLANVTISENSQISGFYEGAFYNCESLTSIYIPEGVQEISDYAFYGCSSLIGFTLHPNCQIKGIYKYALAYTAIEEMFIPESLIELGDYAFGYMTNIKNLTDVVIPSSVTTIGEGVFVGWNKIESLTLPTMERDLGSYFGVNINYLGKTLIPDTLKKVTILSGDIPDFAFCGCESLVEIILPRDMEYIGQWAFVDTRNLDCTLYFPKGITYSGSPLWNNYNKSLYLFEEELESLPDEAKTDARPYYGVITYVDNGEYQYGIDKDDYLTIYKYLGNDTEVIIDKIDGHDVYAIARFAFKYRYDIEEVVIKGNVKKIASYAFYSCGGIKKIQIFSNIETIDSNAFDLCHAHISIYCKFNENTEGINEKFAFAEHIYYNIKEVKQNDDFEYFITNDNKIGIIKCVSQLKDIHLDEIDGIPIVRICRNAFDDVEITSLYFGNDIEIIEEGAFSYLSDLKKVYIDSLDSWLNIEFYDSPLAGNNSSRKVYINGQLVRNIVLPENITEIGNYTFSGFENLESIVIPEGVERIGDYAFAHCTSLKSISFPNSIKEIGYGILSKSGVNKINIVSLESWINIEGESLFIIYNADLYIGNDLVTDVVIPEGVTTLRNGLFDGFTSIKSITLPSTLTTISREALARTSIESITIPNGVTKIEEYAFNRCFSLQSVFIPDNGMTIKSLAFNQCTNAIICLEATDVPSTYENQWCELTSYCLGVKGAGSNELFTYIVDGNNRATLVKYLGSEKDLIIDKIDGKDICGFANRLFRDNKIIETVVIKAPVEKISDELFYGCDSLYSVIMPNTIKEIGDYAFGMCISIKELTLPCNLQVIGDHSFVGVEFEYGIIIPSTVTKIGGYAFYYLYNKYILLLQGDSLPEEIAKDWNYGLPYYLQVKELHVNDSYLYFINNSNEATVLKYFGNEKELIINTVDGYPIVSISTNAIPNNHSIEKIEFGSNVKAIEDDAVGYGEFLKMVIISSSVETMYNGSVSFNTQIVFFLKHNSVPSGFEIGWNGGYQYFLGVNRITSNENFDYVITNRNTAIILEYHGTNKNVNAAYIDSCKVVIIESNAFYNRSDIESVVLSDALIEIGINAFYGCSSLENITLPESLKALKDSCFYGCSSLQSITIPSSVIEIGSLAFGNCSNISEVVLSEGLEIIGYNAFDSNLVKEIYIPSTLISSYGLTFNNIQKVYANSLVDWCNIDFGEYGNPIRSGAELYINNVLVVDVVIPEGVLPREGTYLSNTFSNYKYIQSVVIPDYITNLSYRAFYRCSNLKSVVLPETLTEIGSEAFENCEKLESINIPSSIQIINDRCFYNCNSLRGDLLIEATIESIGDYAFLKCEKISTITINGNLYVGNSAFYGTTCKIVFTNYSKISENWNQKWNSYINGSVIYLGEPIVKKNETEGLVFFQYSNSYRVSGYSGTDTDVVIPAYHNGKIVSSITGNAFLYNNNIVSIKLPNTITSLPNNAFKYCTNLETVVLTNKIESIGDYAFFNCSKLKNISIPESVLYFGNHAFENCSSLETIYIPNSIKTISQKCFYGCTSLKEVTGAQNVQYIDSYAFECCNNLETYPFTNKIESIGDQAFSSCNELKNVYLSTNLTSLGYASFSYCCAIEKIVIPSTITEIPNSLFSGCTNLKSIDIKGKITSIGSYAFYNTAIKTFVIPNGITTIENGVFSKCKNLTSIIIPEGVKIISYNAFSGCESLNEIVFPNSLKRIDDAFSGCGIVNLIIPEDVEYVYYGLFNLPSLKTLTILSDKFDFDIFTSSIDEIYVGSNVTKYSVVDGILYDNTTMELIYCPANLKQDIVRIPEGVTTIKKNTFRSSNIGLIVVPESVTTIESNAFLKKVCLAFKANSLPTNCGSFDHSKISYYLGVEDYGIVNDCICISFINKTAYVVRYLYDLDIKQIIIPSYFKNNKITAFTYNLSEYVELQIIQLPNCSTIETISLALPLTCVKVIISKDCETSGSAIRSYSGDVYCYQNKDETLWGNNWNGSGNVYYEGEWCLLSFYDKDGKLIKIDAVLPDEIIKQPTKNELTIVEGNKQYTFVGWDINNDGALDNFPATTATDINATAIYQEECSHADTRLVQDSVFLCIEGGSAHRVCNVCGETIEENIIINPCEHTLIHYEAKEATCTENGYDAYDECEVCSYTTYVGKAALGHKYTDWIFDAEATCIYVGNRHKECEICGEIGVSEVVLPLEHNLVCQETKEATCTEQGYEVCACSMCDYTTNNELAALGHNSVTDNKVEPTCTETGLTEGAHCSRCNEVLVAQTVVEALGHNFQETSRVEPSTKEEGLITYTCSHCGETKTETIEKLPSKKGCVGSISSIVIIPVGLIMTGYVCKKRKELY